MFVPNQTAQWSTPISTDKYGQKTWTPFALIPCAVIDFSPQIKQSPVRTTESASRMYADETENPTVLLFPASNPVSIGDLVVIFGAQLFCVTARSYLDIFGVLDFYECTFQAQQS